MNLLSAKIILTKSWLSILLTRIRYQKVDVAIVNNTSGEAVRFDRATDREERTSAVLSTLTIQDDPGSLTRVAFKISSPKVTKEKMGQHTSFRSMRF